MPDGFAACRLGCVAYISADVGFCMKMSDCESYFPVVSALIRVSCCPQQLVFYLCYAYLKQTTALVRVEYRPRGRYPPQNSVYNRRNTEPVRAQLRHTVLHSIFVIRTLVLHVDTAI